MFCLFSNINILQCSEECQKFLYLLTRIKDPNHQTALAKMKENTEVTGTSHRKGKIEFKGVAGLQYNVQV